MDRLKGKVAIITGAAGGICHKASELFCQEGAKVVMVDIDPQVEQFSAEINANGGESIAVVADVAQRDTWVQLKKLADAKYGRIGGDRQAGAQPLRRLSLAARAGRRQTASACRVFRAFP